MSMPPAKKVASSSHDDGPLNQQEISLVTGLLHRAIKFKQTSQVLAAYQMSHAPKSNYVLHRALLQQCEEMTGEDQGSVAGSMTDATKRLREVEEAEDDGTSSLLLWGQLPALWQSASTVLRGQPGTHSSNALHADPDHAADADHQWQDSFAEGIE